MKIILTQDGTMVNAEQISKVFPPRKDKCDITYDMIIPRDNNGYSPKLASGTFDEMQDLWAKFVSFMANDNSSMFNVNLEKVNNFKI